MRGRRQEKAVLAVLAEALDGLGLLARDGPAVLLRWLGGGAMVNLVDDEQVEKAGELRVARQNLVEHPLHPRRPQPLEADDRPRVNGERVGFEAVASSEFTELGSVDDLEAEPELRVHLLLPLDREGRGADDDNAPRAVAEQHLLDHEAGLDRLAEAHVIGDEEVHPRHRERPRHGFELVLLDHDPAAERRLEGLGVRAGDRAPADGVQERAEGLRVVPAGLGYLGKLSGGDDLAAGLYLPDDRQFLAEVVVADAGEGDEGSAGNPGRSQFILGLVTLADAADDPLLAADAHELPGFRDIRVPTVCACGGKLGRNSRHRPLPGRRRCNASCRARRNEG